MPIQIAVTIPDDPANVLAPGKGVIPRSTAVQAGYVVATDYGHKRRIAADLDAATSAHGADHVAAIMGLPEAKQRPACAAKLAMSYGPTILTAERAKIKLGALPIEATLVSAPATATRTDDKMLRRKADLKLTALAMLANSGDNAARKQAKAISYAFSIVNMGGSTLADALSAAGVDVSKL